MPIAVVAKASCAFLDDESLANAMLFFVSF